ncbi:MAG: TrmH family RNA methyltransferase [Candidatus Saccharimonadales bacterium]
MQKSNNSHLDKTLIEQGDTRNVVDKYRNWKIASIQHDLATSAFPLHIAIENYQHDFNIGSIVRSANAFNVSSVHIIGKKHWNRRGAMSTEKYLQLYHHKNIDDFYQWTLIQKLSIIGVDNIPESVNMATSSLIPRAVYVFGQEGPGLSIEMQNICSSIVAIEQFGSTRSINIGVAAGILMHSWIQQNIPHN